MQDCYITTARKDGEGHAIALKRVAQIKRMEQLAGDRVLLEITYLHGRAGPLTYRVLTEEAEVTPAQHSNGIYLSNERDGRMTPLLIIQRRHYQDSQKYLINLANKSCTVQAVKLVSQTLLYATFEYYVLQEQPAAFEGAGELIKLAV